jgi:hypothetical protein
MVARITRGTTLAYPVCVSHLVDVTRDRIDQSESLKMAILSAVSFVLGLTFLALLVADEAHAAF